MGDYQTTRFVKGVIIPTTDSVETWITRKTGTLRKFEQILRRTNCGLYIFKKKHVKDPKWEDYKDRLFYVGNIHQLIYDTIKKACPNIIDEPLWAYNKDTTLARSLTHLFHIVVNSLYKDKKYWDGAFSRDRVPHRYWSHQPETKKWAEEGIIQMFKEPSYDWLREKVNKLSNPDLNLPPKEDASFEEAVEADVKQRDSDNNKLEKQNYCIDIETEPFKDSSLKALMLKSIQLDDHFIPVTDSNLPILKNQIQGKELIVFNAPFEQTQLTRAGFDVWSNNWLDVSLLTKLHDNRLAESGIASLESLEKHYLGTTTKKELVAKLEKKYGKEFFSHPEIVNDSDFQAYGVNDTRITRELWDKLKNNVSPQLFTSMQSLQDKLTKWAIKGIPFQREKLEAAQQKLRLSQKQSLEKIVDIRFLDKKTKAKLKGWSSTNLKSKYITTYKKEWLPHLKVTPTGKVCFDGEAREKLIEIFPKDKVLQSIYEPLNMKTAIQQIGKLLIYADGNLLYPNYNFLAASTGRFRARQPELQNLVTKENYNVRKLLLEDKNVFMIDFASQEPRFSAYFAKERKSIEAFIAGKNQHTELAKSLNILRPQAKRIGLGLFYGMGHEKCAITLKISNSEAMRIRDTFYQQHAQTFAFIDKLTYQDEVNTPLLGRRIRFSADMRSTKKFNWLIQGSCVDLLLLALEHVLDSKKVELRAHIHDSLYLACLCSDPHPECKQAEEVVKELENLYPFIWPNSNVKVFKFGEIEWTTTA